MKKSTEQIKAKALLYRERWRKKCRDGGRCCDCGTTIGEPPQPRRCAICSDRQNMRGERGRRRAERIDVEGKVPTFADFERMYR